jgi:hypothetical protein
MWLGNQLFVIISDPQVAKDLMVTNGNVFSSRKEMYIKSQTVFAGRGITATPYNDRWSVNPLPLRWFLYSDQTFQAQASSYREYLVDAEGCGYLSSYPRPRITISDQSTLRRRQPWQYSNKPPSESYNVGNPKEVNDG